LPESLKDRVLVEGTRAFKLAFVAHPDDVVAVTKKYLSDKAGKLILLFCCFGVFGIHGNKRAIASTLACQALAGPPILVLPHGRSCKLLSLVPTTCRPRNGEYRLAKVDALGV
jgi:hypothetical protein